MANIEKVIRGLECCTNYGRDKYDDPPCKKCPYTHDSTYEQCCNDNLHKDALELLKKHVPKRMLDVGTHELKNNHKIYYGMCPSCKRKLYYKSSNFCLWCGQAVKWNV